MVTFCKKWLFLPQNSKHRLECVMRVCVLCVAFLMIGLIVNAQQDPQFSQNMFNHMTINPAFAGLQNRWVISGIYRNQWLAMDGAPETYALNVDGQNKKKRWRDRIEHDE